MTTNLRISILRRCPFLQIHALKDRILAKFLFNGQHVIADEAIDVQLQVMNKLELESLRLALDELDDESYQLMYDLYLSENRKTQRELADEYGVSQKVIWKRVKKIKNNLSLWVVKRKKSSQ